MSRIGRKNPPPNRRGREPEAVSPTVDTGNVASDAAGSIDEENAPTTQPLGPGGWLFATALVVAVFLVFQPAWHGGFLFDDDMHLLDNPVLQPGGLAKVWVPGGYLNYWPLTYTAYWLQFKLWGLNPLGFHLVNIAGHAISALLVWRILIRLRVPGARLAAALFALHPVNVESVAWIAQLKGVLALLLALLSVLFFLAQERHGGWWRSVLALVAFLLSTLAKGMMITLPVVLLACAWWQRGRIGRRDLLRVVLYLLIGVVMAGMEVWTQHLVEANTVVRADNLLSRAAVAGRAVWFYLGKLLWPLDLCVVYPRWRIDEQNVLSYLPGVLWGMLLALGWWRRRAWGRPIVMLLVCYAGLLLPVLGFANVYFMLYSLVADHYQYAALIVPCAVFAGTAATLVRGRQGLPRTGSMLCGALLAALAVLTWRQSRIYADAETFYTTTLDKNPACWVAHYNLGVALADRGQFAEAIAHYRKALEIKPDYGAARINLGQALVSRAQFDAAIVEFRQALEIEPGFAAAHNNLGFVLAERGQFAEAIAHYRRALEIKPDYAETHNNLGIALGRRGQFTEAVAEFQRALEIKPDFAAAHNNLGIVLADREQFAEAIAHYRKALEIKPDFAGAHYNLGLALAGRGQFTEAIAEYRKALEINPDYVEAHNNLGVALARRGQFAEAIDQFQRALEIQPENVDAQQNLEALRSRGQ